MGVHAIIMAGGAGTRFWPYSRLEKPKQLLTLFSDKTLIEETIDRLTPIIPKENIHIATNHLLAEQIKKILPDINCIVEPIPKNTAACIGLSAITILSQDPEAIMLVETADHIYKDITSYHHTLNRAIEAAKTGAIVTIGINPTYPHTGLGYIDLGQEITEHEETFMANRFIEKPDLKTAKELLQTGYVVWNSGLFIAKAQSMLDEIRRYLPKLFDGLNAITASGFDKQTITEVFQELESISIDYGVMEQSENIIVVRTNMHWDDVGDFEALERWFDKDEKGNTIVGKMEGNCKDCIILSKERKTTINDVSELTIVDTPDATLICRKEGIKNIRKALEMIKEADLSEYLTSIVENPSQHILAFEADDCQVTTNGLIVLIGTPALEITRTKDELIIEGIEQDV